MAANKFPGRCKCGVFVEAGEGSLAKKANRWVVKCADCQAPVSHAPEREMFGTIYWPNGMGETPCSEEYEDANLELIAAREALDDLGGFGASNDRSFRAPDGYAEAYERYCRASARCDQLQGEGGHLGKPIRYDAPDAMCALLGGGHITVAPGGAVAIRQA